MVKDTTPSWCIMRECGLKPLQFNWFQAAVQLDNALAQRAPLQKKILQADMQLSSRCDDCWSSHILSAMNGLTQSYMFKERLLKREPIDLGRIVVELRERHLDYWTPYSDMHPLERNSKRSTYHQWCALPTKRALVTHSPYTLPRYMLLDLPRGVIRSVARFRLCAHTLRTCAMLMMYKMSNTSLFTAPIHRWSLPGGLMRPYFLAQASTMCLLFWAKK